MSAREAPSVRAAAPEALLFPPRVNPIAGVFYAHAVDPVLVCQSSLQLLEAAFAAPGADRAVCGAGHNPHVCDLSKLMDAVFATKLLDDVAACLGPYLAARNVVERLALPFILFVNHATRAPAIAKVAGAFLELSRREEVLSALKRFFWARVTSASSLHVLVPLILSAALPTDRVRWTLAAVRNGAPAALGAVVADVLHGALRRRMSGGPFTPNRLFAMLQMLPFCCPDFIRAAIPRT
jgi:hypothetical protein